MQFCDNSLNISEPSEVTNLKCMVFVTFVSTYSIVAIIILVLYIIHRVEIIREKNRRIREDQQCDELKTSPQSKLSKYGKATVQNRDREESEYQLPWKSINQNQTLGQTTESNYNPLSNGGNIYRNYKTSSMRSQNEDQSLLSRVGGRSIDDLQGTFHSRNRSMSRQQILLRPDKRLSFGMLDEDEQQSQSNNENLLSQFNSSKITGDNQKQISLRK
ncbi:UNKNOWN [Stylonychia lemnae]|uniref:Uncharacterized protein n=1 Tax=Stylonychia lemnae TaxID=5949 RepID=A0A078AXL1_STYLE|nr:UNKNOWN [Stylonychia lemnae]|eukprot:CDW85538.1 UNKNOWN [Stylonychia lemnae]